MSKQRGTNIAMALLLPQEIRIYGKGERLSVSEHVCACMPVYVRLTTILLIVSSPLKIKHFIFAKSNSSY